MLKNIIFTLNRFSFIEMILIEDKLSFELFFNNIQKIIFNCDFSIQLLNMNLIIKSKNFLIFLEAMNLGEQQIIYNIKF
jgi:hypothetical protein